MRVVENIEEMKEISRTLRADGKMISFVPTMGYLHQGHMSLMKKGREIGDALAASIFVNPAQFGKGEDLESYPRELERDIRLCRAEEVDFLFVPKASEMYPDGYQTYLDLEYVTKNLCGASRPGHFRGVATVVTKLLNIIRPHYAIFGEKDFQQLVVIKRLITDLNMDIDIIGMPIIRETDGLAMSSRNSYLSSNERRDALNISRSLFFVKKIFDEGERTSNVIIDEVRKILENISLIEIDYVKIVDTGSLEDIKTVNNEALLAVAVRIGNTRLIDNILLRNV